MKKIIALLLALALCFSLCACGGGSASKPASSSGDAAVGDRNGDGKITIAYSTIAYQIAVLPQYIYKYLDEGCKARGWELQFLAAEGDAALQGEQVAQLVQQDPDYFVLFPADPTLGIDWAKSIDEAGIPCVTLHLDVADEGKQYVKTYCGPNNYQMAADIAKAIIEKNGADAGLKIVEIGGVPVQSDYIDRVAGFDDYIKANSNYEILGLEWAFSNRADAQTFMENFISTYGDEIDVLMGFDDDLTLGGINALQAAKMPDVQVYSITGQIEAIQAIKDGTMTLTAFYSTQTTVNNCLDCIQALMEGQTPEHDHFTDIPHITADNADQFTGEF